MNLDLLRTLVQTDLSKGLISPRNLMARLPYITPSISFKSSYTDPRNYPSYYCVGRYVKPEKVLVIGLGSGLVPSCLLLGAKRVNTVLLFERKTEAFYSPRMGKHNVERAFKGQFDLYVGDILDGEFEKKLSKCSWDFILFDEEISYDDCLSYLRFLWSYLAEGGILCMNRIKDIPHIGRAFNDFSVERNRDTVTIDSKYGIGILEK